MLPLWLVSLFTTSFAIGTDDMVVAGILPAIATEFDTSEAVAGQLVTAFSLTYAVGAPLMALATARFDRRRVLLVAHAAFVTANVMAYVAPTYEALLALRVIAALAAATISPIAYGLTAALAPPERRGRYLGIVTAGLTVSLIVGVPLGTWIGGTVGWRESFLLVAALGFAAMLGIARAVPTTQGETVLSVRDRFRPLRDRRIGLAVLGVVISGAGGMMSYVYLAPLSSTLADVGPTELALLIATFGVFGVAGTTLGGLGADRIETRRLITLTFGGTTGAAALLLTSTALAPIPFVVLAAMIAVYGLLVWSVNPPVQMRLLAVAGKRLPDVRRGLRDRSAKYSRVACRRSAHQRDRRVRRVPVRPRSLGRAAVRRRGRGLPTQTRGRRGADGGAVRPAQQVVDRPRRRVGAPGPLTRPS